MFIKILSVALAGIECLPITVEIDVAGSWPGFQIIGLPDASIQEAKERIRTAWKNTGIDFPNNKRVVINLAPADLRKEGTSYDLAMAVGMFFASNSEENTLPNFKDCLFVGELALNGTLRSTSGILAIVVFAKEQGYKKIFIPFVNATEASLISGIRIFAVKNLLECLNILNENIQVEALEAKNILSIYTETKSDLDMSFIKGQDFVKRALEIAATGGHNILLSGPPGSGKTLLARTFPSILPPLTPDEIIEVTKLYSVAGLLRAEESVILERPFRAPHHSASIVSIVGGGKYPKPGEISLSHRGILFLDEFPEFPRAILESLRQPLEDGIITVSRAHGSITFPAECILLASQNPCPCGYASDPDKNCSCSPSQILKYQKKISGPLLDRIDLQVEVAKIPLEKLSSKDLEESSKDIRARVIAGREMQYKRFLGKKCKINSEMTNREIREFCSMESSAEEILKIAVSEWQLSARSYHRILKVARSIADLEQKDRIEAAHVAEALQYRGKKQN